MSKYKLSGRSQKELETCDPRLQVIVRAVINAEIMDLTVTEGVRSQEDQDKYYKEGKSRIRWPNGKHNVVEEGQKSKAVDVAPFVSGKLSYNFGHCVHLAGLMIMAGRALGVKLRWGGNWDMDGEPVTDQDFQDLVHYELID